MLLPLNLTSAAGGGFGDVSFFLYCHILGVNMSWIKDLLKLTGIMLLCVVITGSRYVI